MKIIRDNLSRFTLYFSILVSLAFGITTYGLFLQLEPNTIMELGFGMLAFLLLLNLLVLVWNSRGESKITRGDYILIYSVGIILIPLGRWISLYTVLNFAFEVSNEFICLVGIISLIIFILSYFELRQNLFQSKNNQSDMESTLNRADSPINSVEEIDKIITDYRGRHKESKEIPLFGNFKDAVEAIQSNFLLHNKDEASSTVVCIDAPWGAGKTSLINVVSSQNPEYAWMNFSPWSYSNQNEMLEDFFTLFSKTLEVKFGLMIRNELSGMLRILSPVIERTIGVDISGLSLGSQNILRNGLAKRMEKAMGGAKLVIVIDDLDRLYPDQVLLIVRLVRELSELPNVVIFLPFDYKFIAQIISNHFNLSAQYDNYLEKVIHTRIPLNEYNDIELRAIFESTLLSCVNEQLVLSSRHLNRIWENVVIELLRSMSKKRTTDQQRELSRDIIKKSFFRLYGDLYQNGGPYGYRGINVEDRLDWVMNLVNDYPFDIESLIGSISEPIFKIYFGILFPDNGIRVVHSGRSENVEFDHGKGGYLEFAKILENKGPKALFDNHLQKGSPAGKKEGIQNVLNANSKYYKDYPPKEEFDTRAVIQDVITLELELTPRVCKKIAIELAGEINLVGDNEHKHKKLIAELISIRY